MSNPLLRLILPVFYLCVFVPAVSAGDLKLTGIDEVIFQEDRLLLVRYSSWTYQMWNSAELLKAGSEKTLEKEWKPLVRPNNEFVPRQVVGGQSRNLLILDAVNQRIWQLDSLMQVLSSMKIPPELTTEKLMETRMFKSDRYRYTFINVSEGKVHEFLESAGKLNSVFQVNIPLAIKQCYCARGEVSETTYKDYPYWCLSGKYVRAYNPFFSSYKKFPVGKMGQMKTDDFKHSRGISSISISEDKQPVLRYSLNSVSVCYTPLSREFFYCAAQ